MEVYGYDVKLSFKEVTSHDLGKILRAFHDQDYWGPECNCEIETVYKERTKKNE